MLEPIGLFVQFVMCMTIFNGGCATEKNTVVTTETPLLQAIQNAKEEADYRLYSMGGRVPAFPGTDFKRYDELLEQCGLKVIDNGGDTLTSESQMQSHDKAYQFAVQYNQKMVPLCLQQK